MIALLCANTGAHSAYHAILDAAFSLPGLGPRSVRWLVNDALMVVFFFVVGLEIRREAHDGCLSTPRRAALPLAAALGGMIAPALIYLAVAGEPAIRRGWGVPMATDIAFAVGILSLLGRRVPAELRILLLALAVIDDLGSIVVIAFFYSSGVSAIGLWVVAVALLAVFGLQRLSVRHPAAYAVPAFLAWAGTYGAGVHPTIAGVLLGLLTPVTTAGTETESPSERLEHALAPWVAFVLLPLFAFSNAGVPLSALGDDPSARHVSTGVVLGLVLGKPVGIVGVSLLATRLRIATLPSSLGVKHLVVLGFVAGIGFTMSLFVAELAFTEPSHLLASKIGILGASLVAALLGLALGRWLLPTPVAQGRSAS